MKLKITIFVALLVFAFQANSQEQKGTPPSNYGQGTLLRVSPSINSRTTIIPADVSDRFIEDGRASRNYVVPGKGSTGDDVLAQEAHRLSGTIQGRMPSLVFETSTSTASPTDPSGAIGPNHYFAVFNTGFKIYDKSGNALTGELSPSNLGFSAGFCCDLTVSYDNAVDRWVVSILYGATGPVEVAVSNGPDPTNTTWNVYNYSQIGDYQKLSVWSDGYYLTSNINSGSAGTSDVVFALERDAMLAGDANPGFVAFPLPGIGTSGFFSPQAFNVTDDNLPAAGSMPIVYLQDDAWASVSTADHVKLWEIDVDWNTPANSTITTTPEEIALTPFISVFDGGNFANLTQPNGGADIDALQATIMNQAQFRKFSGHNSALFNFVVDTDGSADDELAGIRWVELRQSGDGQPWSLYQEGTYTSPDGKHAWNASLAMDSQGNIGMGYVAMSGPSTPNDVFVSSYYTGRLANDDLGTMSISEELMQAGNSLIPNLRYSDYSKIDVDPSNNKAFWYNTEVPVNGRKTYAGVFQLAPDNNNDVGVINIDSPTDGTLTNAESITVTVFNFGENAASGFNVTYQVDGGTTITEAFPGSLASQTSAQYTFTTTADLSVEGQTYSITSCTTLSGDEDTTNDCTSADVIFIVANDIGVTEITSPTNGEGLGSETVTVTIENFGTASQSNFDVSYTVDSGSPVTETVAGPLAGGTTLSYSFTTTADLSAVGTYDIVATTSLSGDADTSNNSASVSVNNIACQSDSVSPGSQIGPDANAVTESIISFTDDFVIDDVNVTLNITHTWDADLDMKLIGPDGTEVILAQDVGGSGDDFTDTVFDDQATTPIGNGTAPFTGSFIPQGSLADFNGLQSAGDWTLSITDDANDDQGVLNSWTLQLCGNIGLSVDENEIAGELQVIHKGGNQYVISLPTTTVTDRLTMTVTNMLGQTLFSRRLDNESGQGYEYNLDMSYVASGMYMVRIGNTKAGNTKRIIVE